MPRLIDADAIDWSEIEEEFGKRSTETIAVETLIEAQPTVDAESVKHGYWIWHGSYYTCSVCGEEQYGVDTGRFYCQNCGARMDEVEDG